MQIKTALKTTSHLSNKNSKVWQYTLLEKLQGNGHFHSFNFIVEIQDHVTPKEGNLAISPKTKGMNVPFKLVLQIKLCPLPQIHVEALTLDATIFEDRAFKNIIKVKWGHNGEPLIQQNWCPHKKRKKKYQEHTHTKKSPYEKAAICKPGREVSPEINPFSPLILGFQPPELWESKFLFFKPLSLWFSIIASHPSSLTHQASHNILLQNYPEVTFPTI